jgi:hypothetical protein
MLQRPPCRGHPWRRRSGARAGGRQTRRGAGGRACTRARYRCGQRAGAACGGGGGPSAAARARLGGGWDRVGVWSSPWRRMGGMRERQGVVPVRVCLCCMWSAREGWGRMLLVHAGPGRRGSHHGGMRSSFASAVIAAVDQGHAGGHIKSQQTCLLQMQSRRGRPRRAGLKFFDGASTVDTGSAAHRRRRACH